mgnify:CR=1 FL=1
MKEELQQLQDYIIYLQTRDLYNEIEDRFDKQEVQYYDYIEKVIFSEIDGLFDITWWASDYGTGSDAESEPYILGNKTQHCQCGSPEKCLCYYEGEGLNWLIDVLTKYPEKVRSLNFTGPNCGANGLRDWDLSRLVKANKIFPNLTTFKVQLHEVGHHNATRLTDMDGDNPVFVTSILKLFPNVRDVEIPCVPCADFFNLPFPNLNHLRVQANAENSHFIKNLANSPLLKQISLDYTDNLYIEEEEITDYFKKIKAEEEYIKNAENPVEARKEIQRKRLKESGYSDEEIRFEIDRPNREDSITLIQSFSDDEQEFKDTLAFYDGFRWDENGEAIPEEDFEIDEFELSETYGKPTPFEDYKVFFKSPYLQDRMHFTLRESQLTKEQLFELQKLKDIQFLYVPTYSDFYVSHKMKDKK